MKSINVETDLGEARLASIYHIQSILYLRFIVTRL